MTWYARWRKRRNCFHHWHRTGHEMSWITSELIDSGRRKMFTCTECGRRWFV